MRIASARAALLVVDIQERLAAAMPGEVRDQVERHAVVLVEMAHRLGIPVVVSQQYPKGLGPTVPAIEQALGGRSPADVDVHRFDKVEFSACSAGAFGSVRTALGPRRDQWIVIGMETHVCVYQTARDLLAAGLVVHVPRDAVASRTKANWQVGLGLIERAGGLVSSTEAVLFDALGRAGTEDFKVLSRLIK